ncbi:MAG: TfoX/Sxy family protein [Anaerolineales bacterium]
MPKFPASSPKLRKAFEAAVLDLPPQQVRVVFGYPCLFVNGYMTVGLFGDDLFLRLAEGDQTTLLKQVGKPFSVMPGKAMAGYTVAP